MPSYHVCSSLLFLFNVASIAFAAPPVEEVLRRAPTDARFVVVIADVRRHAEQVASSPFAAAFQSSELGRHLQSLPEVKRLVEVGEHLSEALGIDGVRLRNDLVGDAVMFAYSGGQAGQAESGVLISWLRDPKLGAEVLQRLNDVQLEAGELRELKQHTHRGVTYYQRIKSKEDPEFYVRRGSLFAMSSQESALQRFIELDLEPSNEQWVQRYDSLGQRGTLVSVLLNPRAFDAELDDKVAKAEGADAAFMATFARCWKALQGAALSGRVNQHVDFALTLAVDKQAFPAALLKAASALNRPSPLKAAFADDALLTISASIDVRAMLEALASLMAPDAWKAFSDSVEQGLAPVIGKKYVGLLADHLGPDVGLCVTAPRSDAVFPDAVVAVRVKPSADGKVERALLDAGDSLATLIRFSLNAKDEEPVQIETLRDSGGDIRFLSHDRLFPPGVRPAFALRSGYLLIATSPEAILRLDLSATQKPVEDGPVPLLSASLRGWHRYLQTKREPLLTWTTPDDEARREAAGTLDRIGMMLELFDRFELVNDSALPGQMRLSARLYPVQPLKK